MFKCKKYNGTRLMLTQKDTAHLAHLARLTLTDEELKKYTTQLDETITAVKNLETLHSSPKSVHGFNLTNMAREDSIDTSHSLSQEQALLNTPKTQEGYVVVDKIMEE